MAYSLDRKMHYEWFPRPGVRSHGGTYPPFQVPDPSDEYGHQLEYAPFPEILQLAESTPFLFGLDLLEWKVIQSIL